MGLTLVPLDSNVLTFRLLQPHHHQNEEFLVAVLGLFSDSANGLPCPHSYVAQAERTMNKQCFSSFQEQIAGSTSPRWQLGTLGLPRLRPYILQHLDGWPDASPRARGWRNG